MPRKLEKQPALPLRCSYLDTDVLMERLRAIYISDKNFELEMSNDRLILYAVRKLTKEQRIALSADPEVYSHYAVPGDGYYVGTHQD